jgi:fumarylacetoacetase
VALTQQSWVTSANDPETDFPVQNLPYGVFKFRERCKIGVAIGDRILDLNACAETELFAELPEPLIQACRAELLNPLMSLGGTSWSALRRRISALLDDDQVTSATKDRLVPLLIPMRDVTMQLPARVGDYTDFYASIHHATRVGKLFRPDSPLLPNYKYVPIGYNGRASSIVLSGHPIHRPSGQIRPANTEPIFAASRSLDYELEVGAFIGVGNAMGETIPIADAEEHVFGVCLLNDWSARDIQSWEYQPLGPFLAKNFVTTISPWVVSMEALLPYRVPSAPRPPGDPAPLSYLNSATAELDGIDITLEVLLQSAKMRDNGIAAMPVSKGNMRDLYWSIRQLVTHHASNGCNLRPADLLATGTVSGPVEGSEGCLLEMKHRSSPLTLPTGESRSFLEDGDQVTFRAHAQKEGAPRIGFGECTGTVIGAKNQK